MLVVTTIYFAKLKPVREPATGRIIEREPSELIDAEREVVTMRQGTSRVSRERGA